MSKDLPKQKVLIVDDAPANIRLLWEMVKSEYEVSVAISGDEALEILTDHQCLPDLILLDIMMPGMDGYEVCRRLKADNRTRSIPVIFITAKNLEADETKGLDLGAVDYITKPFRPAIVKARIRTQLEVKQHRDNLEDLVEKRTAELIKLNEQLMKDIAERERAEEQLRQARSEEIQLLEMTTALSFELNLLRLLAKIMDTTKELLTADRCTLFIFDENTNELWSQVAQGLEIKEIRFSSNLGIAGTVFTGGKTINIRDAYTDPRFNPEVDKKTGYRTRSILCMPIKNKNDQIIGVTQVLNKKGGPFTEMDERRLRAFSAQASIALENAKLFEDILNMKNYNESILESMSNGMISLDADKNVVKCNSAALRILREEPDAMIDDPTAAERIKSVFSKANPWIQDAVDKVIKTGKTDLAMDTDLSLTEGSSISVNVSVIPLINIQNQFIGAMLVLEDITTEKRLKGTIARYMTKEVADKLLEDREAVLGGQIQETTVLFSDIRSFTTISERIGPKRTVSLLNEYFSVMVDIIFRYEGILDKYIGDAMLAVFGAPFSTGEDPDRAVRTAIDMLTALEKFNRQRKTAASEPVNIGIGINTDRILSGNIGSLKRMDYTVIGDGVNLASRLEEANKIYGTNILVSEFTYKKLNNSYACREIDMIRVRGKTTPVGIYQIIGYKDAKPLKNIEGILEQFQEGLACYRSREWKKGIKHFTRALNLNKNDTVSQLYIERCRYFLLHPPADDWDNVWIMKSK
ncbi:MAG: response regulator [Desulfobacterales bacterium]|nr:response regulator [Desulfobacterales bacterium]